MALILFYLDEMMLNTHRYLPDLGLNKEFWSLELQVQDEKTGETRAAVQQNLELYPGLEAPRVPRPEPGSTMQ